MVQIIFVLFEYSMCVYKNRNDHTDANARAAYHILNHSALLSLLPLLACPPEPFSPRAVLCSAVFFPPTAVCDQHYIIHRLNVCTQSMPITPRSSSVAPTTARTPNDVYCHVLQARLTATPLRADTHVLSTTVHGRRQQQENSANLKTR